MDMDNLFSLIPEKEFESDKRFITFEWNSTERKTDYNVILRKPKKIDLFLRLYTNMS